jgi:hypothetical protein
VPGLVIERCPALVREIADRPYKHVANGRKTDLVELPVQWLLDDALYWHYGTLLVRYPGCCSRHHC